MSDIKDKKTFDDFITFWLNNQSRMSKISTLFTFDDAGNESPIEPLVSSFSDEKFFVKSIFSRKNVYFLNADIWLEMLAKEEKKVPIDCVLSLDTQFGKYALKYIKDPEFKNTDIGSSFENLLKFVHGNKINPEFSFYLQENYSNYLIGKKKEITNQLYALVKLVDLDKDEFIQSGTIKLNYGPDELNARVNNLLSSFKDKHITNHYENMEHLQTSIACLILKAALLKREKMDHEDKVKKLVLFCHDVISVMLGLELYVMSRWLLDQKIDFFDPVNGGDNLHTLTKRIHGMAWDFMLIRHVERYCSNFDRKRYSLAYFSTFDRRMANMSDLYKNRGCIFPPKNEFGRFFMVPEIELDKWYSDVLGNDFSFRIFNSDMIEHRDNNRPSAVKLATLRRGLEYELLNHYAKK